jgi:hypothetical protein
MRKSLFERPAQLRLTLPTNAQHRKALMSKYRVVFSSAAAIAVSLLAFVEPARADVGAEMEAEEQGGDVGDQMKADEAGGEGGATRESGNTNRGPRRRERASGPVGRFGTEDRFGAPTGPTGAGLTLSPAQRGRFWGELGFHTQEALTVWVPVLGGGYKLSPNIELELILPFVYGSRDASNPLTNEFEDRTTFVSGDPFVGVNYLHGSGDLRYKAGAGIALPFAPDSDVGHFLALSSASKIRGFQDDFLWHGRTMSLVAPFRIEYGGRVFFGGDAWLALLLPTSGDDRDAELALALAPGVGFWVTPNTLLGARLGLYWAATEEGDNAQLSFEPNFRQHFGKGFFQARFTVNVDQPAGFSFDPGGFWGLHLGGGVSF